MKRLGFLASVLLLAATAGMVHAAESRAAQLDKMYGEFWEEYLKLNPVTATFAGDPRYNAELPNFLTADFEAQSKAFEKKYLDRARAIGTDADRLAAGQAVRIRSATSGTEAEGRVGSLLPVAGSGQSVIARLALPNPEGRWRPGMTVSATVTVASREVPLAVKESGLQRFRDFTVVFAQAGETYEVRRSFVSFGELNAGVELLFTDAYDNHWARTPHSLERRETPPMTC